MVEESESYFFNNVFNVAYNNITNPINPENDFISFLDKLCDEFQIDNNDKNF